VLPLFTGLPTRCVLGKPYFTLPDAYALGPGLPELFRASRNSISLIWWRQPRLPLSDWGYQPKTDGPFAKIDGEGGAGRAAPTHAWPLCGGDTELLDANIALFIVASLAVIVAPGPDNIYVLTRGIAQGREVALASAWGMCSGLLFHTTLAALGLSAVLAQSAVAFSVVKYVGAAYLVYLGVRAFLSKEEFASSTEEEPTAKLRGFFLRGLTMNLLNPKVAAFFLAFLPQFASPATDGAALQLLALGLIFALLSVVIFSAIALFSGILGDRLSRNPRFATALQLLTGCVLIGLGVRLALSGRQ
jgi:threonine/homoserine/homoserine lactone efflux protein